MKKTKTLAAICLVVVFSFSAFAEEQQSNSQASGQTEMKLNDATKDAQKSDIDEEITNAKLRAESGSKSKLSMSFSMAYSGGSVEKPLDRLRPNYRQGLTPIATSFYSTVNGRYRLSQSESLTLGTGLSFKQPLHRAYGNEQEWKDNTNVSSPNLGYSKYYKVAGYQMASNVDVTYYTTDAAKATGYQATIGAGQTVMGEFGTSGISWGISAAAEYSQIDSGRGVLNQFKDYLLDLGYSQAAVNGVGMDSLRAEQVDLTYGIYPFAEYTINDKYSLRTVFGYFNYERYLGQSDFRWTENYQSVGVGMAVTRDIYLYPNIQFVPSDMRPQRTNVAISATVNMF